MKRLSLLYVFILIGFIGLGQDSTGKILVDQLYSNALENDGGENPTRSITVHLPPGYDQSTKRYPVIYFLHGFLSNDTIMSNRFDKLLDKAITAGKIRPVIIVFPNQYTLYRGSFYSNSTLTGKWADFTAKDLVTFIDDKYRTIPSHESRGIAGHSMGGQGAVKIGMLFPDVFSSVYGLSSGIFALVKEFGPNGSAFKQAQEISTKEELTIGFNEAVANVVVAMGRTYSPNPLNPPFYADLPFTYVGDSLIINHKVLELWNNNLLIEIVDDYIENLRKLKAIKIDWGRNDGMEMIPFSNKMFSQKLEKLGIKHYAEEYIGDHYDKLFTDDGRILNDMFPFFNTYLNFE